MRQHIRRQRTDLEIELLVIQRAIRWSGSALIVGGLIGLGLGVRLGLKAGRTRARETAER